MQSKFKFGNTFIRHNNTLTYLKLSCRQIQKIYFVINKTEGIQYVFRMVAFLLVMISFDLLKPASN